MDYNQDFAINRLQVLDDTNVTCDKNACAIFNGGIYVEKDIYANNIKIKNFKNNYICSKQADISTANIETGKIHIGNFQSINIKNGIYPSDIMSNATIGSNDKKWNEIYGTNGNFQVINTNTANTKNLKYENLITYVSTQTIPCDFDLEDYFNVQLDKDIIFINICEIFDYTDECLVRIKIQKSTVPYEHHKIVLNQIHNYKILWSIPGCVDFISGYKSQVYEIINIPYVGWKLIKYSLNTGYEEQSCDVESESETESNSECESVTDVSCCDLSSCFIKKTYIKYIYKYPSELTGEIGDIKDLVDNLSKKVLKQNEQLTVLDSLVKKCDLLTNNTLCLEKKHDNLKLEISNSKKTHESFDEILRTVKKNEDKIKDITHYILDKQELPDKNNICDICETYKRKVVYTKCRHKVCIVCAVHCDKCANCRTNLTDKDKILM